MAKVQVRPAQKRHAPRKIFRVALLCFGAAAASVPVIAVAQQVGALRGEVSETDINSELLGGRQLDAQTTGATQDDQGIPTPEYQPASEGALPDTDTQPSSDSTAQSIFDDGQEQSGGQPKSSIFGDDVEPSTAAPSTARERQDARRQQVETAADRQEAERLRRTQAAQQNQDPDTSGTVRTPTIDAQQEELKTDPESEREEAIESLDKQPEDNPYAPLGIRVGTFLVTPSVDSGLTWTNNANSSTDGEPAVLSETTLRLNALSEFGGDRTSFDGYGNFRKTVSGEDIEETRARLDAALERDLGGDWKALASLGYEIGPQSASAPDAIEGTLEQPIVQTIDGSLGIEKDIGKLQLRLTGSLEREMYGDAELSTGGTVSQADRNSTLGALVLRAGYEVSPALTPFVELEYGRLIYDEEVDSSGYDRSSTRIGGRAGLELGLSEKLTGEFSAGWIDEELDDARLAAVAGPSVAGALAWSPWRGTLVNLDASTIVESSTDAGQSGSLLYSGRIAVSRELRANLTADLGFGAAYRDYIGMDGNDVILNADASMTWWLNRYAGLTGRLRHENLESSLPDRDYSANSVFLGLKLQR